MRESEQPASTPAASSILIAHPGLLDPNFHKTVLLLTNIGETWYRMGDVPHAVEKLKESERLAEEIGDQLLLAEAARGLGKAYLLQGDLTKK